MTIPNSSSDGLILLAHGTPNVLGEMDTYMKFVTGGRAVPPELVHELQERYAQIGLGDEPADDCKLTAKLVASELEDIVSERDYHFSFQSQGMSGGPGSAPRSKTLATSK